MSNVISSNGIDASKERRPGVPMEKDPPSPVEGAHWREPEQQPDPGNILKRKGLEELTPVFGTTLPPRGLSGYIRRLAYERPEHHTSHWFALMLADRIDVIEHNPLRTFAFVAGGLGAATLLFFGLKRRS